ncbi:camphor resistance protein CrcB [Tamilnaduibacter salinus]|uniref:Fluoride-specific ion channel FluC n=1 Tax=Tamilnaduibacter salinus TaxID=1484056 RepID=A0A2U1CWJ9_9GAMM|nr:fluoride efflux transporter CrcB [Tamilnaduibacter salinus]PVY76323.1 camphor resistance protein CrcB [Tamilnaduibacter salinus]
MVTPTAVLAVSLGAVVGANARWVLGLWLNQGGQLVPVGTLVANLAGAWLAGLAISYFSQASALSAEWRLFAVTGLCGALTTFSTFSLEMVGALQEGRWAAAVAGMAVHLFGALLMTGLGILCFQWLRG